MGIISASIPNFINGISQQPFATRLASQAEEQINGYSSVVEGLTKRPPTKHVGKLLASLPDKSHLHIINRDAAERYVVIATDGDLKVFDFAGNEKVVSFPDGKAYLASPECNFSTTTVADYTFFLNKDVVTALGPETHKVRRHEALVYIRQGNYATTYTVIINGTKLTFTTSSTDPDEIQTQAIAERMATLIQGTGMLVEVSGSTILVVHPNDAAFTIRAQDSLGDTAIICLTKQVQSFVGLPAKAFEGYQVEVTGAASTSADNYYLTYTEAGTSGATGIWRESPKPGRKTNLSPATMPHTLIRNADGTFTFKRAEWDPCKAGDDRTVKEPSFIGKRINDVFFHRGRLGLIADESIILSEASETFNFWRKTATGLLDNDPIDVSVAHTKVSILSHAVPFNESLLLFSDQTQFIIRGGEALTPFTISVDQTTEFETSLRARPVGSGAFVYFATLRGAYSGLREFYVDGNTKVNSANDVTSHVPRYIPGGVFKIAASTNEDILIALSDKNRDTIYVHKFFYSGQEKVQSSWSRWKFAPGDVILNAEFIESTLWLVIKRADGVYLERMDLEPGTTDEGMNYIVLLDRRLTEDQVVVQHNGSFTDITLPYEVPEGAKLEFVARAGDRNPAGRILNWTRFGNAYRVRGYVTHFYAGLSYALRYTFSPLVVRQEATGGGQIANTEGRLQLRRMILNYADTGYFRIEVTPRGRDTYTNVFSGRVVGSDRNRIGVAAIETGSFKFPIMAMNLNVDIVLVNDTPMPTRLLNADWEALYIVRTARL